MSKDRLRLSGKTIVFPEASPAELLPRPGGWLLCRFPDGTQRRIFTHEERGKLSASTSGRLWRGEVARSERMQSSATGAGDSDLVAQFPGKVRKLLVEEGAQVEEAQPLLLVEAMKMEFAVKAPSRGKVARLLVREGQQLSPGDRFLDFEAAENAGG